MNEHRPDLARRRRNASVTAAVLVALCVAAAFVPAATRLLSEGWASFVERPPGVGGSPETAGVGDEAAGADAEAHASDPQSGSASEPLTPPATTSTTLSPAPPRRTVPPARSSGAGRRRRVRARPR